ncbi:MAG: hypothetical protein LBC53_02365 [Spirochaetaceae bacterium]|nr:hypothetical protein [Spirochaetaceae bacterium]
MKDAGDVGGGGAWAYSQSVFIARGSDLRRRKEWRGGCLRAHTELRDSG